MATADVTIYGAGIFGLSVAYACQQRGARAQVIDPAGVAAGASGGVVGALAPHTPDSWNAKKQFQYESLLMARDFWPKVAAQTGMNTGYCPAGRVQALNDARVLDLAHTRVGQATDRWQGHAEWRVLSQGDAGDWAPISATGYLAHDTLSAHIHPRRAVLALARAVEMAGGVICADGPAQGKIVWATGWQGLQENGIGTGVKGQAAVLEFATPHKAQLFANGIHLVPHNDGTVAVGSTTEAKFAAPNTVDDAIDGVIAQARAIYPMLRDASVLARWAGVRPKTGNRNPILGHHPQHKGQYIANGGFKIGFSIAPKLGVVMADLILEGRESIPKIFFAK